MTKESYASARRVFWVVAAEQDRNGAWVARGGAGGSGQGPERDEPWVNLAGWWGPKLSRRSRHMRGRTIGKSWGR